MGEGGDAEAVGVALDAGDEQLAAVDQRVDEIAESAESDAASERKRQIQRTDKA